MYEVTIEPPETTGGKGRSFRAILAAYVTADGLWEGGEAGTDTHRPVYAVFACSDGEASAFAANLRCGRRAEQVNDKGHRSRGDKLARWEFLRSAGYQFATQRHAALGSTVIQAVLPHLLRFQGIGMVDPKVASFVMLPGRTWAERQRLDDAAALRHLRAVGCKVPEATLRAHFPALAAAGALFAGYLDGRTRCPLVLDVRLHVQLMVAAVEEKLAAVHTGWSGSGDPPWGASRAIGYSEHGLADVGLLPGVAMMAKHEVLEPFLAEQVTKFMRKVKL